MHKLYWRLLMEERTVLLLGMMLSVVTAFAGIALLAVSGWFISAAALAGLTAAAAHAFNFFTPGAIVRGLSIARTAGRYGERLANHETTFRLIAKLRTQIFERLAAQQGVSALINRHQSASQMLQDITNVEGIHLHALVPAMTALLSALGFVLVSALFVPTLSLVTIPLLLISILGIPWLYARTLLAPETELQLSRSSLWSRTSALFSSLRLLTLTQQLAVQGETVRDEARKADQFELTALKRQQLMLLLAQLSGLIFLGVTLSLAVDAYQADQIDGALVFMLLLLALGTNEVVAAANGALGYLLLGKRALARLDKLSTLSKTQSDNRLFGAAHNNGIEISDLSFSYDENSTPVLTNLSLSLQSPSLYWLGGESGRGKTSLLRLLAGELNTETGSIAFACEGPESVRYMPQQVQILRSTLRHNLDLKSQHSDEQIWHALEAVQLAQWAKELPQGLDTWIGKGEWEPSGGEIKRLGLARVLLQQTKVILLDEPFAGIDLELQRELMEELRRVWRDRLVIIVSHDLELRTSEEALIAL